MIVWENLWEESLCDSSSTHLDWNLRCIIWATSLAVMMVSKTRAALRSISPLRWLLRRSKSLFSSLGKAVDHLSSRLRLRAGSKISVAITALTWKKQIWLRCEQCKTPADSKNFHYAPWADGISASPICWCKYMLGVGQSPHPKELSRQLPESFARPRTDSCK